MKTLFNKILMFTFVILTLFAAYSFAEEALNLRLLHFNDLYEVAPKTDPLGQKYGGLSELKTLIDQKKQEVKNSLVTFGGDLMPATLVSFPLSPHDKIELMNHMGIDVAVLGNHEFDFGAETTLSLINASTFPWVIDNIDYKGNPVFGNTLPYKIFTFGDYKIAFIGFILPETKNLSSPGSNVNFTIPSLKAKPLVLKLKKEGVDVIIALTHQTLKEDQQLLKDVKEIDLILGGHEHRPIAYFIDQKKMIYKTGYDGTYLGVLDLQIERYSDKEGSHIFLIHNWQMIPVRNFQPNPEVHTLIQELENKIDPSFFDPLANLDIDLDSRRSKIDTKQTSMGSLVADAFKNELETDIATINGGAIRGDRLYSKGTTLSRQNLMQELPFKDYAVICSIKGADLKKWLEYGLKNVEEPNGSFPQISGFQLTYDPKAPDGNKIKKMIVNDQPFDMNKIYKIATLSYLTTQRHEPSKLNCTQKQATKYLSSDILINYVKKLKKVNVEQTPKDRIEMIQK